MRGCVLQTLYRSVLFYRLNCSCSQSVLQPWPRFILSLQLVVPKYRAKLYNKYYFYILLRRIKWMCFVVVNIFYVYVDCSSYFEYDGLRAKQKYTDKLNGKPNAYNDCSFKFSNVSCHWLLPYACGEVSTSFKKV